MYALSAVLAEQHSSDIRCCCMDAMGHIITGSRDKTALVWEQDPNCHAATSAAAKWRVFCKLTGHVGFVNAVATLKNTEEFPSGLILTAGQDKLINVYCLSISESEPIKQLAGHTEGVTCLSTGWNGTVLSGSADCTVRVWEDLELKEVLSGHTAPVWDVAIYPGRGTYISASGDKSIRLWRDGKQETVYQGHTDAVRKVVVLPDDTFMSCSNDGTVRHWNVTGPCLSVIQLGDNFLYSMCMLPNGIFAVSGEKGNMFILQDGAIKQNIQIPALSVWCCEPLPLSDILIGSSDGVARIFTSDEAKYAPLADREQMSEQLAAQKHSKQAIGDLELSKLPGPEALNRGGKEGQTLMINRAGSVEVYQFSGGSWQNLGVVQDAYDKDKHELDGKKYDHVINVDIQDGVPPLKLGCNKEDDPWVVAQNFINKHSLPQEYLTQIADYITKNTGIGNKPMEVNPEFCDPFTGSGRYVPPTDNGSQRSAPTSTLGTSRYYPSTRLLTEPIPDASKLIKKITEHNALVNENQRLNDVELAHFEKIAKKTSEGELLGSEDMALVAKLLSWDPDRIFPCIDLARSINKAFPDIFDLQDKLQIAVSNYKKPSVSCVRVSLRLLVDITLQHTNQCVNQFAELIAPVLDCLNTTDKKFPSISISKILFNLTCVDSDIITSRHILGSIMIVLQYITRELEEKDRQVPQFNLLVATGNLITRCGQLTEYVGNYKPVLQQFAAAVDGKTKVTANDILSAL